VEGAENWLMGNEKVVDWGKSLMEDLPELS
jgi:hypothetical protein